MGQLGEEFADFVEDFDVGGGVGAGSAADWGLVDIDGFIDEFEAIDAVVEAGFTDATIDIAVDDLPKDVIDETALPGTAHTGHADESAEGKFGGDLFEVIVAGVVNDEAAAVG